MAAAETVGFIGLGRMGAGMAANLQKAGFRLVVSDLSPAAAEKAICAGAIWADSPREVARQADVIFLSLPVPADVEQVVLGGNGIVHGIKPGATVFDLSTNSVQVVRSLHATLQEHGANFLDAPVSGGVAGAISGKLAIWVGGDEALFNRFKPLLDAMGDEAVHIGPIGAGTIAKLAHNSASSMIALVLSEVFTMGIKAGLDPLPLWKAVRQGASGRQRTFDTVTAQFLTGQWQDAGFTLKLMHKDVGLAVELGKSVNVPMHIAEYTLKEMTEARQRGWDELGSRAAMLLQVERAGIPPVAVDPAEIRAEMQKDKG